MLIYQFMHAQVTFPTLPCELLVGQLVPCVACCPLGRSFGTPPIVFLLLVALLATAVTHCRTCFCNGLLPVDADTSCTF